MLDVAGVAGAVAGDEAMFTHAVIVDGQVAGHWRRSLAAKAMTIQVQLVRQLARAETDALHAAVERYAGFVDLPGQLVVT